MGRQAIPAESPEATSVFSTQSGATSRIRWYNTRSVPNTNRILLRQERPSSTRAFTQHSIFHQEFRITDRMGFFGSSKPVKAQRKGPDGKVRTRRRQPLVRESDDGAGCNLVLPMDITCNVSMPDDWSDVSMPSESGKKKKSFLQRIFSRPGNFKNKTDYSFRT